MSSTGTDFRGLTPLVLIEALRRAGAQVHEPMHRFRVEAPADTLGALLPVLAGFAAVPETARSRGGLCVLEGTVPVARCTPSGSGCRGSPGARANWRAPSLTMRQSCTARFPSVRAPTTTR
jgi:hypothetical protein